MQTRFPQWARRFQKTHGKVWRAVQKLGEECHRAGPLAARSRRLVKIGIAAGSGSEGAMHSAVRNALAEGVSRDEIRHAILLSITTIGFPNGQAALSWAEDVMRRK
jgi:alkylhydroperoxidase/carboxymuconolactone decarboxylase family protein YurZ